jgi:predicted transcriptional regulator
MLLSDACQTIWINPMPPITIRFDDETEAKLRRIAKDLNLTLSDLVRRLVAEGLDAVPQKMTPYEAWEKIFTGETTGQTNLSRDYKKIIGEKVRAKHARRRRAVDSSV